MQGTANTTKRAQPAPALSAKAERGARSCAQGHSAELQVQRFYERRGARLLQHRWRGQAGEIDLIFQMGADIVCAEVKSSRSHASAVQLLGAHQRRRLALAVEEFIGGQPLGSLTSVRVEVALVDNQGSIEIIENALMAA